MIQNKYIVPMLCALGFSIGMITESVENESGAKMHLILAMVIIFATPLWILLISKIEIFFSEKPRMFKYPKKIWIAWVTLGIFFGQIISLFSTGIRLIPAISLASPFLAVFLGIFIFVWGQKWHCHRTSPGK